MLARVNNLRLHSNEDLVNEANWKRVSKHGNSKKGFCRKFKNTKCSLTVSVYSTETDITDIKVSKTNVQEPATGGLFKICKDLMNRDQNGQWYSPIEDPRGVVYALPWSNKDGIPNVILDSDDDNEEPETEQVDFENCGVLKITDSEITVYAGGDWQPCTTFTAKLGADGLLHCIEHHLTTDNEGYDVELETDEFKKIIGL